MKHSLDDLFNLMKDIEIRISLNSDPLPKEIGDIVKVWDGSSFTTYDGVKKYIVDEEWKDKSAIVIETDRDYFYKTGLLGIEYKQDLVIFFPHNKQKMRISSQGVAHI